MTTLQSLGRFANRQLLGAVAAAALTSGAAAQSIDYATLEQLFGEPVTTSVTGSPQRASDVPASMEIISAEDIRRSGARDLPTLLNHVAGVDVMQTTLDHADVGVRGYNQALSPRLLVLVDGRQVYADFSGYTPWSTIPVELSGIRQIEVVRGPNSALFGFNAVGGVINIITYDPVQDMQASVSAVAGTQGLTGVSAVSGWKIGDASGIRIMAGHSTDDDFSTPLRATDVGTRRGDGRDAVSVKAGTRFGDSIRAEFEATSSHVEQVETDNVYALHWGRYQTDSLEARLSADTRLGVVEGSVYTNDIQVESFPGEQVDALVLVRNQVTVGRIQSLSKIGSRHTLRLTAEHRNDRMGTTPIGGAKVLYDVNSLGAMWEGQLAEKLTLTTAVRIDRLDLARKGAVPLGYTLRNSDWDRSFSERSFNAGVVWRASDADRVRFLVARGAQLPNLLNLGGLLLSIPPIGFATGLPTLAPTIVTSYEVSWERRLATLGATLRISAFHGRTTDIVASVGGSDFAAGFALMPVTIGGSRVTGIEIAISGAAANGWRWGASYTPLSVNDRFSPGYELATTLVDFEHTTPRNTLNTNLGWARGPWEADGYLRYRSAVDAIAVSASLFGALTPISAYTSLDARIAYRWNDRATLALAGQGLTRSDRSESSAPNIERRVLGTATVRF